MDKILFSFDTSSHMHRVYQTMISKDIHKKPESFYNGLPIYFIQGFFNLIFSEIKFMKEQHNIEPTHLAFVFDGCNENNFRKKLYSLYKANRDESTPEFIFQKRMIYKILNTLGFATLSQKEYEADDIIATISNKISNTNIKHYIFTKDKDMFALINDNNFVVRGTTFDIYDKNKVIEDKGVRPDQMNDFLTLLGDKADNIIGVNGCGEKTALAILNKHTLNDILINPELINELDGVGKAIKKKVFEYISNNIDFIRLMESLVEMKKDIDLNTNFNQLVRKEINKNEYLKVLNYIGMHELNYTFLR